MAVKASAAVTLSAVVDVKAIWRYYLLQSSTMAAPAKPTVYPPPSTWTDTEPVFDPTKTETLYVVDCNVFSDDTFDYTAVSVSTAFEAAKAAYNKATNAMLHTVVQSATAPTATTYMWLDISLDPPLLKRYDPETATWVIVNDTTAIVYNLEQNLEASITKSAEDITAKVAESYSLQEDTEALVSEVSTQLSLTKGSFDIQFTQFSADLEAVATGVDTEFEEIRKYIRFEEGKILLGEVGNELELEIANNRISFLQDGAEVAYFSNRKMYVADTQVQHSLQLGSFAWMPRANGNLSFKKI